MNIQEFYDSIDESYENVSSRMMGNQKLVEKFVRKFLDDPTYEQIKEAVNKMDYDEILRTTHTMKGIASNLEFTHLHQILSSYLRQVLLHLTLKAHVSYLLNLSLVYLICSFFAKSLCEIISYHQEKNNYKKDLFRNRKRPFCVYKFFRPFNIVKSINNTGMISASN